MASPQVEDGYTRFANELLEAIARQRLPGQELRVLLAIARKTYGYGKKTDAISYNQIAYLTDISRRKVIAVVRKLKDRNILSSAPRGTRKPSTIGINKNYQTWLPSALQGTSAPQGTRDSAPQGTRSSALQGTHKRKKESNKEINTSSSEISDSRQEIPKAPPKPKSKPRTKKTFPPDSEEIRLSTLLADLISQRYPKFKQPNIQAWAIYIDQAIRIDKRTPAEIETVIYWCQEDQFWQSNILSTAKLREKFDQLVLKMDKKMGRNKHSGINDWLNKKEAING